MSIERRTFISGAFGAVSALALAACGGNTSTSSNTNSQQAQQDGGKSFKVGILKFVDHPSLNQIESNIVAQLQKIATGGGAKYEIIQLNGGADGSVLQQMCTQLISDKVDVIVPIATPAAQVVQSATEDSKLPVVFSAISDPVGAKLVNSMTEPGGHITGTSDALNTEAILSLMTAAKPELKKVGLLYSNSEDSSKQPIADAKKWLESHNIETVERTGTNTDEVIQAVEALIADKVEAIFTPTDNTVMSAELAFYEKLQQAKIPHYTGADSFALNGAFVGYGVDYTQLGIATANMIDSILAGGQDPAKTAVGTFENGIVTINTETCKAIGFDLEKIKDAFMPFVTEIDEIVTGKEFGE